MMWPRWISTVYALTGAIHYHAGCFLSICNSWNSLKFTEGLEMEHVRLLKDVESQHFKGALKATVDTRDFLFLSLTSGWFPRVNFPVEFRASRWRWRLGGWRGGGVRVAEWINGKSEQQKLGSDFEVGTLHASLLIDHWRPWVFSTDPWGCSMPIFTGKACGWGHDRYVWLYWYTAIQRDMWQIHVLWYKGKMQFE